MPRFTGTTTPPTTASPFNSGPLETELADRVTGIIFCDKAGSLLVEQSIDGTNWDLSKAIAVTAGTGLGFSEELLAPYYRIKFTPTTDSTVFRLAARLASAGAR